MGRVVALDYGTKRCGLAISDPLGMFASGLDTIAAPQLIKEVVKLHEALDLETLVIGLPKRMSGELSEVETHILRAIEHIQKALPDLKIVRIDERFSSKLAMQAMIEAGATKKQRRDKGNVDKVSATLLLQEYLNSN